jgi:hypothetical protein
MRTRLAPVALAVLLVAAAAPAGAIVHTLEVEAHGQCRDGDGGGGSGDVRVFPWGLEADAVDVQEAQSIAAAVTLFAGGTADDAADGSPGDDEACPADDTDAGGTDTHGSEDHVSASATWLSGSVAAGVCYDAEGPHTSSDTSPCHEQDDDSGGYTVHGPALP